MDDLFCAWGSALGPQLTLHRPSEPISITHLATGPSEEAGVLAVALNTTALPAHGKLATTLFTDGLSLLCSRVHLQVDLAEAYKLCELH